MDWRLKQKYIDDSLGMIFIFVFSKTRQKLTTFSVVSLVPKS